MEKSALNTNIEREDQIRHAASILFERNANSVAQLIGYRQRIAQDMLNGRDRFNPENYKLLEEMFEHTNRQIRTILALEPIKIT